MSLATNLLVSDTELVLVYVHAETHPDLMFASCGGGGGTFGVVTSLTFNINILPNDGSVVIADVSIV
jgi:FAD/FMN-containing dehydrogenase